MKYRKRPVVIEAIQWTGKNVEDIVAFFKASDSEAIYDTENKVFEIKTLEGVMTASVNDYIIKGINDEFYPCKPDIFDKTYEVVEEPTIKSRRVIKG